MTQVSNKKNQPIPDFRRSVSKNNFLFKFVGLPLAIYFIYKLFYPTYSWHEKMIVTVSTPQGERSGSAVRSVKIVRTPKLLPQITGGKVSLKGEAVVVDLGNKQYLFALLSAPAGWAGSVYVENIPAARRGFADVEKWGSSLRGKGIFDVPINSYPRLVIFDELDDPTSVKVVKPEQFNEVFGKGYSLKSITLQITNEQIVWGIVEDAIDWITSADFIIPPDQQPFLSKDQTPEQRLVPYNFIDLETLTNK